jgi:deazaflavin-dependent oxidoreductase (nitroreductase family)
VSDAERQRWAKYNEPVFEEARMNHGKSRRGEVIILHTIGAKTGREHVIPLNFTQDGDRFIVVASLGGAPKNPNWYHNLVAHPDIDIEVAGETRRLRARVTEGAERDEFFGKAVAKHGFYAGFQKKTTRVIPVIALEPIAP